MKNKIINGAIYVFLFVICCIKLIETSILTIFRIKSSIENDMFIFAILYQFFSVLIVLALFSKRIDLVLREFLIGNGNLFSAIILVVLIIIILLVINSLIELVFRIKNCGESFEHIFSIQKYFHSYMMTLISLIAIYTAIDTYNSDTINTLLLTVGIVIFICIIITDLYYTFYLSQGIVKKIYDDFKFDFENCKK